MGCCGQEAATATNGDQQAEGSSGSTKEQVIAPKDDNGTFKAKDWKALMDKMPVEKTEAAAKRRQDIWNKMNEYNNGSVSMKKMSKDMEKYLGLPKKVTDKGCLEKAYNNAKDKVKTKQGGDDSFIQFAEFRIFLVYLKQYLQYWVMFENLGGGKTMTLSLNQLKDATKILESYGVKISDPDAEFKKIDKDGSGKVSFDEFADYAIAKELEIEPETDYDGSVLKKK